MTTINEDDIYTPTIEQDIENVNKTIPNYAKVLDSKTKRIGSKAILLTYTLEQPISRINELKTTLSYGLRTRGVSKLDTVSMRGNKLEVVIENLSK